MKTLSIIKVSIVPGAFSLPLSGATDMYYIYTHAKLSVASGIREHSISALRGILGISQCTY